MITRRIPRRAAVSALLAAIAIAAFLFASGGVIPGPVGNYPAIGLPKSGPIDGRGAPAAQDPVVPADKIAGPPQQPHMTTTAIQP